MGCFFGGVARQLAATIGLVFELGQQDRGDTYPDEQCKASEEPERSPFRRLVSLFDRNHVFSL